MKNKKLLLIKLSSLGDVIFNIPLSYRLKDAGYEVTWLVSEKGFDILNNNPCVDKVILAPIFEWRKRGFSIKNFIEFWKIIKKLRSEKFDISIDSQMMFKSLFFNLFCGAKRRITSKKAKELSIFGANELVKGISYSPKTHIVLNYLKFAKYLGIENESIKTALPERSEEQILKVNDLLKGLDERPIVVIAPATTWQNKHWDVENWKAVIKEISSVANIVFTGGEKDKELINKINEANHTNLAGKTDLPELIEVFSRAKVVVSPDSGSSHLAWALAKPSVITIFTCTPEKVLAPLGDKSKYISIAGKLDCRPCFKRKCRLKNNKNACTYIPNPNEVIEAIKGVLT